MSSFFKCFYFNKGLKKYQVVEPEDAFTLLYDGSKKKIK